MMSGEDMAALEAAAGLEASGLFASPVPVDDDAPMLVRLLALTGRDAR